jgi:hypothetical protein
LGLGDHPVPAGKSHPAALAPIDPEHHAGGFRAAGAEEPGEADDFARAHIDAHVAHLAAGHEVLHVEEGPLPGPAAAAGAGLVLARLELAADHGGDEIELRDRVHGRHANGAPVAHDRDRVAHRVELVELVAHEDHRDAGGFELADHVEENADLLLVQRRGGLVHDDEPCVEADGAGDRHHLLHGGGIGHHRLAHVHMHVEAGEQRLRLLVHGAPVEKPEAAALAAEADVLGHRAVRDEVDLLVDRGDAGGLRLGGLREGDRLAVEQDLARIAGVVAREDLDQRRFAGAVLPDERMHLPAPDLERRARERRDAREALVDAAHGEEGLGHGLFGWSDQHLSPLAGRGSHRRTGRCDKRSETERG